MAKTVYEIALQVDGATQARRDLREVSDQTEQLSLLVAQDLGPAMLEAGQRITDLFARIEEANRGFERGLTNLQNITGQSREAIEDYAGELEGLLDSTGYQISQNDALVASYDAASAGFKDTADALGVTDAAMRVAIAGTGDLGSASSNLQSSQTAVIVGLKNYTAELENYGDVSAQATKVAEVLDRTIDQGITTIDELAPAFAELAPLASGAGLSLEETATSLAQITSTGIKAAQATTGMKAVLGAIASGGATNEAKQLIEDLGIGFNAATLETEGFMAVLEDLQNAGLTSFEDLFKLTGSQEAAGALLTMLDSTGERLDSTREKLDAYSEASTLNEKVTNKAADAMGQFEGAVNRFDAELAKVSSGAGLKGFQTQLLELGTTVLETFNALPEGVQQFVLSLGALSGVVLTVGGGVVVMAAQLGAAMSTFKAITAAVKATTVAKTAYAIATGKAATATVGLNAALVKMYAAALPLAGPLVAAAGAVGALTLAWQQYQNIRSQEQSAEELSGLQQTEPLVQSVSRLVLKYRELGEAIPEAEYRRYMAVLEDANDEHGSLDGIIRGLTAAYNQGKPAAEGQAEATRQTAQASGQAADAKDREAEAEEKLSKAREEAAEALKTALELSQEEFSRAEERIANEVRDGTISLADSYNQRSANLTTLAQAAQAAYDQVIQSEVASSDQIKEAQKDLRDHQEQMQLERAELHREWAAELRRHAQDVQTIERNQLETQAYREQWTAEQRTQALKELREKQLAQTIDTIQAELDTVEAGSVRQRELYVDLTAKQAELARSQNEEAIQDREAALAEQQRLEEEAQDERERLAKEEAAEQERLAKESEEAYKDAKRRETEAFRAELDLRKQAAQAQADFERSLNDFRQSRNQIQQDGVSLLGSTSDAQAQARSEVAAIEERIAQLRQQQKETGELDTAQMAQLKADLAEQQKIEQLLTVEKQRQVDFLRAQGVQIGSNLSQMELQQAMTQANLELDLQRIDLEQQQLKSQRDLAFLEEQRFQLEQDRLLLSEDLSEAERANIEKQIEASMKRQELLARELELAGSLAALEQAQLTNQARADLAGQGIDPSGIQGVELDESSVRALTQSDKEAIQSWEAGNNRVQEAITQGNSAQIEQATALSQAVEQANQTQAQSTQQQIDATRSGFGDSLAATQAQTAELSSQLASLEAAVSSLPRAIAASIPRPQPQKR